MTAVAYPTTLPNPTRLTHRPNMRAVISDLPGRPALASKERSYSGAADVEFFFNSTQAAEFYAWWNEALARGGYWFNTSWPAVLPGLNTCQFVTDPVFTHVYDGAFKVSATVQVRPNSGDLSPPDPNDDLYSYVRWLYLMEGADNSQVFHEEIGPDDYVGENNAKQVVADKPFGSSSGYFDGTNDRVSVIPTKEVWNSYSTPFTIDVQVKIQDFLSGDIHTLVSDDSTAGGAPFSLTFSVSSTGVPFCTFPNPSPSAISSILVTAGTWNHLAVTGDPGGVRRVFVNGVHGGTGQQVGSAPWTSNNFYLAEQNRLATAPLYRRNLKGWLKCARCTVGVNRYPGTASFTPPNALANYAPVP